ncbi:hypothetical protein BGY98DRAFT_390479 [Russula aff. rugulosa BPL654]|nr:hypothetical protein BGY98DRAFT_390479 [Russula aff. rugulosa BPL654]
MSISTERTQYPPLQSLHEHSRPTSTLVITGTHPNRAPHPSQLSLAPPNDRMNLRYMGFTQVPLIRLLFHLRWLRDMLFRVLLPAFLLALAFVLRCRSTIMNCIARSLSVDHVNHDSVNYDHASDCSARAIYELVTNGCPHRDRKTTALAVGIRVCHLCQVVMGIGNGKRLRGRAQSCRKRRQCSSCRWVML